MSSIGTRRPSSTWSRLSNRTICCVRSIASWILSFVRELTAACYADGLGRPSIDPEVYFRMQLVAYLYGITSERQLCEDVYYNLAYRWFCRLSLKDEVPDHSSLTQIRDRFGEEIFETVFRQIVALCRKKGLVHEECRVMTDATLIAADAATCRWCTTNRRKPSRRSHRRRVIPRSSCHSRKFPTTRTIVARIPTPRWPARIGRRCNSSTKCIRRSTRRVASFWTRR